MSTSEPEPSLIEPGKRGIPLTYVVALVPVAAALNIVAGAIGTALRLPVFLDMIGTAVVAITIGPWWGALVGVITNVGTATMINPVSLPFAAANVAGALIWGYGVRFGMGRTVLRFFILSLIVALGVTITAVPIYVFVFGGATGHFADMMTAAFLAAGAQLVGAVFMSNIIVSVADKVFSAFVALAIVEALPKNLQVTGDLIESETMTRVLIITGGVVLGVILIVVAMLIGV